MPRPETNALHDRADAVRTRSGELDLGHYGVRCLGACGYGKEGGATCDCMHCIASLYALLASVRCVAGETRRRMQAELRFSAVHGSTQGAAVYTGWAFVLSDAAALRGVRAAATATVRVWRFTVKSTAERCRAAWLAGAARRQQHGPAQRPWSGNAAR